MRKTWLAVLALGLSAVPAAAQQSDVQPLPHRATTLGSLWATSKKAEPPTAPIVPVAAPPVPVPPVVVHAPAPPPPGGCANGKCTSGLTHGPHLRRALEWFCY